MGLALDRSRFVTVIVLHFLVDIFKYLLCMYVNSAIAPILLFFFISKSNNNNIGYETHTHTCKCNTHAFHMYVLCTHTYYVCYFRCTALAQTYHHHDSKTAAAAVVSSSSFIFDVFIFQFQFFKIGTFRLTARFQLLLTRLAIAQSYRCDFLQYLSLLFCYFHFFLLDFWFSRSD